RINERFSHLLIFSDCAFVVCNSALSLAQHAMYLEWDFVTYDMPIRMGMAKGTFYPGTFSSTAASPVINRAVFYVTGIVRAHTAEATGKGCRVLLDSSLTAEHRLSIQQEIAILEIPPEATGTGFELNYLLSKPPSEGDTAFGDGYFLASMREMIKKLPDPVPQ